MNRDLISRAALRKEFDHKCHGECCVCVERDDESGECGLVRWAPVVDAAIVVRCKDCRHSELLRDSELKKESPWCYYMEHCRLCRNTDLVDDESLLVEDDFYCAFGEHRDGGSK